MASGWSDTTHELLPSLACTRVRHSELLVAGVAAALIGSTRNAKTNEDKLQRLERSDGGTCQELLLALGQSDGGNLLRQTAPYLKCLLLPLKSLAGRRLWRGNSRRCIPRSLPDAALAPTAPLAPIETDRITFALTLTRWGLEEACYEARESVFRALPREEYTS